MLLRNGLTLLSLVLAGCGAGGAVAPQAIVGAMLIDGTPQPPVPRAVVVVSSGKILATGPSGSVRIPRSAAVIQAQGRFVFPLDPASPIRAGGPANLLVLTVNPAREPNYMQFVAGRMEGGRWIVYPR